MNISTFIKSFEAMPKYIQNRILEYANSILQTSQKNSGATMKFDWQGGLKNVKESSIELQHKANDWR